MKRYIPKRHIKANIIRGDIALERLALRENFPYEIDTIADNLVIPWAMDISDTDVLYFTERPGNIKMIQNSILNERPLITLESPFISEGEGGLMGLALDPNFSQNHYMYIMYTFRENNQIFNRVVRYVEENNTLKESQILLDYIPGGLVHNGGRLKIGPDYKLYITTGDAGVPSLSQDLNSNAGKILRIELDGRIPEDNPFPNSPIYSYGFRNPQGLAWNTNNTMYASEHGPTGHDAIYVILPGENYGWPLNQEAETAEENVNIQKSLIESGTDTWAPSGIAFIKEGPWQGKLLIAALRGQELLELTLNSEGITVLNVENWFQNEFGRLRDVIEGKDGFVYFSTNNRDGRGNPTYGDDRIVRLMPKSMQ